MEQGFTRLCPPATRLFVADGGAAGSVALIGLGEQELLTWAERSLLSGDDFVQLAAAPEVHGFVTACIGAANVWAPNGKQVTAFAILDHPVGDQEVADEVLRTHACLVDQLVDSYPD